MQQQDILRVDKNETAAFFLNSVPPPFQTSRWMLKNMHKNIYIRRG